MKKLIIILFLTPILAISQKNKPFIPKDKIFHLSAGCLISETAYIPYYSGNWDFRTSTKVAFWGSITIACYKEMADSYGQTGWSWNDIGCTMAGSLTTIGVNYVIHKFKKRKHKKQIKTLVEF
jgi:uncharacterized protein YfiM (DUF2279 family)